MIRNTFVFGIGGTGSRVVRALTMLLASGVKLQDTNKIIPVIIDVDAENADTTRTLKALQAYKSIRQKAYNAQKDAAGAEMPEGFFNTNLNTLSSLQPESGERKIEDSFQLQFDNLKTSFIRYVDPQEQLNDDITMDLLRALYDDTPVNHPNFRNTELNLRLDQGFKGNPNIGCVVFNNLSTLREYQFVLRSIGENDRIFIISSIFGGTGSSGFPQLIKLLKGEERLNQVKFGALTVMPYYKIAEKKKNNQESAINSDTFNAKTEAALTYYAKHLKGKLNALYHIWDSPLKQYDNNEGGLEQLDPAHLVELLGATAVIDFVNKSDEALTATIRTDYYDFGIRQEAACVDFRHFYDTSRIRIMEPLAKFGYAMKIYLDYLNGMKDEVFYKDHDLKHKLGTDAFYQTLTAFFQTHFKGWLQEMAGNERQFQPFNLQEELNSFINGKQITIKKMLGFTRDAGLNESFLKERLGKLEDELKKNIPDTEKEKRFLMLLNKIAGECYAVLGGLPTMTD